MGEPLACEALRRVGLVYVCMMLLRGGERGTGVAASLSETSPVLASSSDSESDWRAPRLAVAASNLNLSVLAARELVSYRCLGSAALLALLGPAEEVEGRSS
jgi:hypothetical protein